MAIDEIEWVRKLKKKDFTYQELLDSLPSLVEHMPNQFQLICYSIINIDLIIASKMQWKQIELYRAKALNLYSTPSTTIILQCLDLSCRMLRTVEPLLKVKQLKPRNIPVKEIKDSEIVTPPKRRGGRRSISKE